MPNALLCCVGFSKTSHNRTTVEFHRVHQHKNSCLSHNTFFIIIIPDQTHKKCHKQYMSTESCACIVANNNNNTIAKHKQVGYIRLLSPYSCNARSNNRQVVLWKCVRRSTTEFLVSTYWNIDRL